MSSSPITLSPLRLLRLLASHAVMSPHQAAFTLAFMVYIDWKLALTAFVSVRTIIVTMA